MKMKSSPTQRAPFRSIITALAASGLLFGASAQAQEDYTWNSAAAGVWAAEGSWTPAGGPPGASDTAIFDAVGTDVRFRADATVANVSKIGTLSEQIQNDGSSPNANNVLTVTNLLSHTGGGGTMVWQSNSSTRQTGMNLNNVTVDGAGTLRLGRNVNQLGQGLSSLSVSGTTNILNGGILSVYTAPAVTASFGVVNFSATGNNRFYLNEATTAAGQQNNKMVTVAGLTGGSANTRVAIQAGNNAGANTILRINGSGTYSFAGRIFNNDGGGATSLTSVEITGGGTQILTQQSDWGGSTTISNGGLLIDGSHLGRGGNYTIGANGWLGGNGTIGHAAGVTSGNATMTFQSGSGLVFDPSETLTINADNLDSFTVNLAGISVASLVNRDGSGIAWSSIAQDTYTLIDGTATLSNVNTDWVNNIGGSGLNARFLTDNGLQLEVVPEPSTYAAILGLLALGLVWFRRRKG